MHVLIWCCRVGPCCQTWVLVCWYDDDCDDDDDDRLVVVNDDDNDRIP